LQEDQFFDDPQVSVDLVWSRWLFAATFSVGWESYEPRVRSSRHALQSSPGGRAACLPCPRR